MEHSRWKRFYPSVCPLGFAGVCGSVSVARPSGRYGFVCSPYTGELVDVRGIPRGAKVGDPGTGRAFINP